MTVAAEAQLHHGAAAAEAYRCEWIFGFGSLISNPGFEHSDKVEPCYIKGWRRVFWQGSTDHRGTPEAPGRTVTLVASEGAVTWGAAFRLAGDAEQRRDTISYLEWREKQYDLREIVPVFTPEGGDAQPTLTALVYIATDDTAANPNYLGPAPLEEVAAQIARAAGPSGPNCDYLFKLAKSMRGMGVQDEELFQLEARVKQLMQLEGGEGGGGDGPAASETVAVGGGAQRGEQDRARAAALPGADATEPS